MDDILQSWPTWLICILFLSILVIVSLSGLLLFRKYFKAETLKTSHDVTGIIYGAITVIYSLVLAFVIVAVWNDYELINGDMGKEAAKLEGIVSHSEELPDGIGVVIRTAVGAYAHSVINSEWTVMQAGKSDESTVQALEYIRKIAFQSISTNDREQVILRLIHDDISDVSDLREDRLMHIRSHVPALVWMVLIAGSIITTVYSYFFFMESTRLQYVIISFLTIMIGMCLFLVFMLDHPFVGSSRISMQPFLDLIQSLPS